MSILKNTVFGELWVSITNEPQNEVVIAEAGFEDERHVGVSTRVHAIKILRKIADWLESQEQSNEQH